MATNTEYLKTLITTAGGDASSLPDNLESTHYKALIEALANGTGGGGASGGELTLLHSIILEEDTKFISQDLDKGYDRIVIEFSNLWSVEGNSCGVSVWINKGSVSSLTHFAEIGSFINSSSYPSIGIVDVEKIHDYARATIVGKNNTGNSGGSGVSLANSIIDKISNTRITKIGFSLSAQLRNTMNTGAVINIYGG